MSSLKLIMEKGPREGETLEYNCRSVVRIGRVARGNTFAIKDAGISTKHISIRFDNDQWILSDLDSSNGTVLNGERLEPFLPSALNDGDCIKIGELTSILVKIENIPSGSYRNRRPKRQGKSEAKTAAVVVDEVKSVLGLGFDDLGKKNVEVVEKRNLRSRAKKTTENSMDSSVSCGRVLRTSKKEIPNLNADDVRKPKKMTRGRKQKEVLVDENLPEGREVAEELEKSRRDGSEEVVVDESLLQGKEDGSEEGLVKEASNLQLEDFEKMTIEDFFDYLEVQLPKEIREESEKTMADLAIKTRRCYELNVLKLQSDIREELVRSIKRKKHYDRALFFAYGIRE